MCTSSIVIYSSFYLIFVNFRCQQPLCRRSNIFSVSFLAYFFNTKQLTFIHVLCINRNAYELYTLHHRSQVYYILCLSCQSFIYRTLEISILSCIFIHMHHRIYVWVPLFFFFFSFVYVFHIFIKKKKKLGFIIFIYTMKLCDVFHDN